MPSLMRKASTGGSHIGIEAERMLVILILLTVFLVWGAWRIRFDQRPLSSLMFLVATALAVLAIGGFFGWL